MAGESAIYKKFRAEQDAADAAYKKWEQEQWDKNGSEWTKQGYTRTVDPNRTWGSKWTKTNPIITPPTDPISEVKEEKIPETIARPKEENTTPPTYNWNQIPVWNNISSQPTKVVTKTTPLSGLNIDPKYGQKVDIKGDFEKFLSWLTGTSVSFNKQGGTMNKVKYFQQGGQAQAANVQKQVEALVQAAMAGDQKATQQVNQIMEAAKAGDQQAAQLAQMIQAVAQKLQGQATMNKWGSKLQYIRSLKFAKGGKTCPACMSDGGSAPEKLQNKKQKMHVNPSDTVHVKDQPKSLTNSDGSRVDKRFPAYTAKDYQNDKKTKDGQKRRMKADLVSSEKCGGTTPKAKKHYFGGWL